MGIIILTSRGCHKFKRQIMTNSQPSMGASDLMAVLMMMVTMTTMT